MHSIRIEYHCTNCEQGANCIPTTTNKSYTIRRTVFVYSLKGIAFWTVIISSTDLVLIKKQKTGVFNSKE